MSKWAVLSFLVVPLEGDRTGVLCVTPILNGTPLTDLIASFEREHNFMPAGGYAGLVPTRYSFGPLNLYFLPESNDESLEAAEHYFLGCTCGEVGCWPLVGRIATVADGIVWDRFRQPHRPGRDYSGFGPFKFESQQYRSVLDEIASQFSDAERL